MPEALQFLDFVHLPSYARSAKGLMTDDEQRDLEQTLLANPKAGSDDEKQQMRRLTVNLEAEP